jgi:glycosyltransferase involved in cell wall biosynthesis
LTITENLKNQALRFLPLNQEQIRVLYYGVPKQNQTNITVCNQYFNEIGFDGEIFTVGLFGRIEYAKGQHVLIDATLKLINEGERIQSAIIGHIMDQSYYKKLKKKVNDSGCDNAIRFAGFHPNPTSIMGCFDVIVLATEVETFGLVLPEAMRAGTAVIGTNAGGVPEIIQDGKTGFLFEPGNAGELAQCLKKFIKSPELHKKLAMNGKIFADENFSEEKHFAELNHYLLV